MNQVITRKLAYDNLENAIRIYMEAFDEEVVGGKCFDILLNSTINHIFMITETHKMFKEGEENG